jgi:hypothetical protein
VYGLSNNVVCPRCNHKLSEGCSEVVG